MSLKSYMQLRINQSPLLFALKQEVDVLPSRLLGRRAANRSWSQFGEDEILSNELGDVLQTGYFLDIGVNHPTKLSNTFRLYAMGMRGIVVEPDERLCRLHTKYRPGDIQLCAASGERDGLATFYRLSWHALSTFSHEDCERQIANGVKLISKSLVPVFTTSTILPRQRNLWVTFGSTMAENLVKPLPDRAFSGGRRSQECRLFHREVFLI